MKVQLWAFSKENEGYIQEGVQRFSDRLRHYCEFSIRILHAGKNSGRLSSAALKKKEAQSVLNVLEADHILYILDEKGKEITSMGLSKLLENHQMLASKTLVFLIGGAYGIDESILLKARSVISLSKLTFPHQLVQLILAEQLYRAFTILNHEKYHHL